MMLSEKFSLKFSVLKVYLCICLISFALPVSTHAADWSSLGSGMTSRVNALIVDGISNLYVGGKFTGAGGISAKYIAKWNGTTWSVLGSGMEGYDYYTSIYALSFDSAGNLYAGGHFNRSGDNSLFLYNIAKWDGMAWSALGSGISEYYAVYAIAFDNADNLYAGGLFTKAGDVSAKNIAKWNGTAWSALGSGMNDTVSALVFDKVGNLYAGGAFTTAVGVSASKIAKWNGTSWSALGAGMDNAVKALAVDSSGNLYAGGDFTTAGGVSANKIAKWDGTNWSALGSGMNGSVYALSFDKTGNLYASGNFTTAGGTPTNRIAKWDGTTWSALGSGMNDIVYALSFDSSGNLYAGGNFTSLDYTIQYIAMWKSDTQTTPGLADVITVLRIVAGISASKPASVSDVNNDGKIGLEEVIYILQKLSGLR